jgi:hypothetical protein
MESKKTGFTEYLRNNFGITIMLIVTFIFISATSYLVWNYFTSYKVIPPYEGQIVVDTLQPVLKLDYMKEYFSDEKIKAYEEGRGLKVDFQFLYLGDIETPIQFIIDPWKTFEETSNPERREYISKKREAFEKLLKDCQVYKPHTWVIEIYVDNTDGVNKRYRDKIKEAMDDLNIEKNLSRKDKYEIYFYLLSNTDFLNVKKLSLDPDSPKEAVNNLKEKIDLFYGDQGSQEQSSVATGFFNAATYNKAKKYRHLVIFTDGVENNDNTVSLYKDPSLLEKANWPRLDEILTKFKPLPDLKRCKVNWYLPPQDTNTNDRSPLLNKAQDYWRHVLEKAGVKSENITMIF